MNTYLALSISGSNERAEVTRFKLEKEENEDEEEFGLLLDPLLEVEDEVMVRLYKRKAARRRTRKGVPFSVMSVCLGAERIED